MISRIPWVRYRAEVSQATFSNTASLDSIADWQASMAFSALIDHSPAPRVWGRDFTANSGTFPNLLPRYPALSAIDSSQHTENRSWSVIAGS